MLLQPSLYLLGEFVVHRGSKLNWPQGSKVFWHERLDFIVYACEEHEVVAERFEQVFHRDHRGAGGNKIVEHDYVALLWWLSPKGEHRPDTMLRVALGNIFVERYAEKRAYLRGNERSEVARLVATFGRGNDAPVA